MLKVKRTELGRCMEVLYGILLMKVLYTQVYWFLGAPDAVVPDSWPEDLATEINMEHPINMSDAYGAFITVCSYLSLFIFIYL